MYTMESSPPEIMVLLSEMTSNDRMGPAWTFSCWYNERFFHNVMVPFSQPVKMYSLHFNLLTTRRDDCAGMSLKCFSIKVFDLMLHSDKCCTPQVMNFMLFCSIIYCSFYKIQMSLIFHVPECSKLFRAITFLLFQSMTWMTSWYMELMP